MFDGPEIAGVIAELGFTHVVWLPDSTLGLWEDALESSSAFDFIRVCREGEAWPLAAGLHLGGQTPLVLMQSTGLFESGDALRNVVYDLRIPLYAVIGARNYLTEGSQDPAKRFVEPILNAWEIDYTLIHTTADKPKLASHCLTSRQTGRPAVSLIAEGRG